jgi:hypothetical protein
MSTGFAKIDAKLDACDLKLSGIVGQLGNLEAKFDKLLKLDTKFDKLLEEIARS